MITLLHSCDYMYEYNGVYRKVQSKNIFLTKRILSKSEKTQANTPPEFKLGESYSPSSLELLYPLLLRLENDPHTMVVRYQFKDSEVGDIVKRQGKFVTMVPSEIIAMDVDSISLPEHIDSLDLIAQGKYIISLLNQVNPEFFPLDMGFIAQGSASAGLSDKIKLHMWLLNKSPVSQLQLKNCFSLINRDFKKISKEVLIDLALYSVVQPHYTSKPIFADVTLDPFRGGSRTSLVKGSTCFIPANFPEYVKPTEVTQLEVESFLDSIEGSTVINSYVADALQVVKSWNPSVRGLRNKVIALYHTAIQQQFSLELLDQEVKKLLSVLRPGEELDYIRQGKKAAIAHIKACSNRTLNPVVKGLKLAHVSTENTEKFLKLSKGLPKNGLVFLKATLGTGKTHLISHMLRTGQIKGKFLAITDTSALVESNAKRFEALDFRKPDAINSFMRGETDRLSGTLHSLHKLVDCAHMFDFVFIDEADSVMNNLLFAPIIEESTRLRILDVLATLLKKTTLCILSDGDLGEQSVIAYMDLVKGSRDMYKINHQRENLRGVTAYKHLNEASLWSRLSDQLHKGKKCLLVSDSSPNSLNCYLNSLKRIHKTKNIHVIHTSSKLDPETVDIINHTTEALRRLNIDALLCSPSVTNGVDFNYFDSVFVLTKTDSHTPNMRFQAMMRERQPKEIHYYIANIAKFSTGYGSVIADSGWLATTRQLYSNRREAEYKTYKATFAYYLVKAGARVRSIDEPAENPRTEEDRNNYIIERANAIVSANEMITIPRHNDAYDIQKLIKALYNLDEVDYSSAYMFIKRDLNKQLELLHILADDYWDVLKKNDPVLLKRELSKTGHKFYLLTGKSLSTSPPARILVQCGIYPDEFDLKELIELYTRFCNYYSIKPSAKIVPPTNNISELGQL